MSDQPEALRVAALLDLWPNLQPEVTAARLLREQHAEIERLRRALKFIKNLTVEIDGCPASAFQTEGWMREIAREALEDKP